MCYSDAWVCIQVTKKKPKLLIRFFGVWFANNQLKYKIINPLEYNLTKGKQNQ